MAVREHAYSVSRAEDRALHRKFGAVVALVQLANSHSLHTTAGSPEHCISALVCVAGDWIQLVWFSWHMQVGLGLIPRFLVLALCLVRPGAVIKLQLRLVAQRGG